MRTVPQYVLNSPIVMNSSFLLLKNGDIFAKLYGSPYELNVAESKRKHAKHWHKWEKRGNKFVYKKNNGKEYTWKKWHETVPAKKSETINGVFKTVNPFGGFEVIGFNRIMFTKNGEFAVMHVKGGNTPSISVLEKSGQKGTYVLDRYSITLKHEGKPADSFLFFFYPDNHKYFVIGRTHFLPVDE